MCSYTKLQYRYCLLILYEILIPTRSTHALFSSSKMDIFQHCVSNIESYPNLNKRPATPREASTSVSWSTAHLCCQTSTKIMPTVSSTSRLYRRQLRGYGWTDRRIAGARTRFQTDARVSHTSSIIGNGGIGVDKRYVSCGVVTCRDGCKLSSCGSTNDERHSALCSSRKKACGREDSCAWLVAWPTDNRRYRRRSRMTTGATTMDWMAVLVIGLLAATAAVCCCTSTTHNSCASYSTCTDSPASRTTLYSPMSNMSTTNTNKNGNNTSIMSWLYQHLFYALLLSLFLLQVIGVLAFISQSAEIFYGCLALMVAVIALITAHHEKDH